MGYHGGQVRVYYMSWQWVGTTVAVSTTVVRFITRYIREQELGDARWEQLALFQQLEQRLELLLCLCLHFSAKTG